MSEVPGTDRDQARENVREETPIVPDDIEGDDDPLTTSDPHNTGDEGQTGDSAKPPAGSTEPLT
ncbi:MULTISPECIES: hypothetical protein [unclassified Blastococcus]